MVNLRKYKKYDPESGKVKEYEQFLVSPTKRPKSNHPYEWVDNNEIIYQRVPVTQKPIYFNNSNQKKPVETDKKKEREITPSKWEIVRKDLNKPKSNKKVFFILNY